MNLVENPLKRRPKRARTMTEEIMGEEAINEDAEEINTKVELTKVIKVMAKIFYKREHLRKEGLIYEFDKMQRLL